MTSGTHGTLPWINLWRQGCLHVVNCISYLLPWLGLAAFRSSKGLGMFREILHCFQAASKICFLLEIDRHPVWVPRMNCKHRGFFCCLFFFFWCSSALLTEAKWHCTRDVQQTTAGHVVLGLFGSFRNLRIQGRKNALPFSPLTKCWSQWPLALDAAQGLRKILLVHSVLSGKTLWMQESWDSWKEY